MAEVTGMTPDKINQEIINVKSYVDGGLSEKADKSQVTSDLSKKADKTQVASDLSKKADITYVDSGLSKKADTTYVDSLSPLKSFVGSGIPEGKVAASVGTIYTDTEATNGAIRWIKTSGTGTTGWKVEYGDTGTRIHNDLAEGFDFTGGSHHKMTLRRVGEQVFLEAQGVRTIRNAWVTNNIPGGFRPRPGEYNSLRGFLFSGRTLSSIGNGGTLHRLSISGDIPEEEALVLLKVDWFTSDSWPTSLPGTPA